MGLLKKLKLVEEVDVDQANSGYIGSDVDYEEDVDVNLDEVNTDTLVSDIYEQNELSDQSKSIFKIEDLMNALPKEMVTETKKNSVLSALGVFGLTSEEVVADGSKRVEILNAALNKITSEKDDAITDYQDAIESAKETIADLEKSIAKEQAELKASTETIVAEASRINKLISFVGGEA